MNLSDSLTRFAAALEGSLPKVSLVAAHFIRRKHYHIQYTPPVIPKTRSECQSDCGDLIAWKGDGPKHVIEVKGLKYDSETLMGFPYILIDKKTTFDKKETRPFMYYIVGSDTDYALMFYVKDWEHTEIQKYKDQQTGNLDPCYHAEPKHFTRIKL